MVNVLSLFDGMSTGHTALDNVGIKVNKYYSSEIKPYAIKLTQHHYPDTIQLGDVTKWEDWNIDWQSIGMILSGSPCQDLSAAGQHTERKGLEGNRSNLFYVFVKILNHIKELNPNVLFLQENVGSAPKKDVGIMSRALGVYPVKINSKLVTAQLRDRYYWTNIKTNKDLLGDLFVDIPQPANQGIILKDILTSGSSDRDKHCCLMERYIQANTFVNDDYKSWERYIKKRNDKTGMVTIINDKSCFRLVNKIEMCRLQGFPDDWCDILSYREAGSLLGDGWTLPIIEHIFSFINKQELNNV